MRRLVAALACRMEGRRLYGKPLQNLDIEEGVSILEHIVRLLRTLPEIDEIVLGISDGTANQPFVDFAERHALGHIRGDERDVLSRLIACGQAGHGTDVFRVTTESPFFYFDMVPEAWRRHVRSGNDVTVIDGVPEGCHFEIYTLRALEESHDQGDERHRSEYCSLYIREHRGDFKIEIVAAPAEVNRLDLRLTVDYPEDLVVCRNVYGHLKSHVPRLPLSEIVRFLDNHSELKALVAGYLDPRPLWAAS